MLAIRDPPLTSLRSHRKIPLAGRPVAARRGGAQGPQGADFAHAAGLGYV